MKKPILHYSSRKSSGNIYWILGAARVILAEERWITDYNTMFEQVQKSKSYEEALKAISEYVTLVDDETRR